MVEKDKEYIENDPFYKGLSVNKGVSQPLPTDKKSIDRFLTKNRKLLSADEYVKGIVAGNITILSKAVTIIESSKPAHQDIAREIVLKCMPYSGNSVRVGITGVPGVGKSTFIEVLGKQITSQNKKLAVLAVDPSSERSKGSILGDKTRMEELSGDPLAYIRPSPSAGSLGGVARKTRETIVLCETAGFSTIFIETVGVGQSETAVHSMTDFFLLLMLAGAGDELQGIKRGIMEMADIIAINKADGNNLEKTLLAKAQYENALHLFPPKESEWQPKVLTCSALKKTGIYEIWNSIEDYRLTTAKNGYFIKRRNEQSLYWMYETINEQLKLQFYNNPEIKKSIKEFENKILNAGISSFDAAGELLKMLYK
ncbi:MAG: methylmalonyl Co-A mutase-associated GTPase MeaB [Prolixibacteraceae bacterium]|nr:methylmalonyl Co-A mutase-associated GTPase MeaB [Prolixibacteraceae bacterium]MBN2774336.1 methylmalonyl Co-A mutase-associated GTPase MeaB [Prolixibacteraceae bacterium]